MKIVILSDGIPPDRSGGAERVAWLSALDLQRVGHDVHVITTTTESTFSEKRQGVMTYHLHAHYPIRWQAWWSLWNPQTVGALRRLLTQIRPDVLHAHNIHHYLSYASLTVAHQLGIPVVWTAHDVMAVAYGKLMHFIDPTLRRPYRVPTPEQYRLPRFYNMRQMHFRYNPARNLIIRHIVTRHVQARLAVSNAQRQALEANGFPRFEVVYNGIDATQYDGAEVEALCIALRERWQLAGNKVVLFAGRLTVEKGSAQLFKAMQRIIAQVPDTKLLILTNQADAWDHSPYRDALADHVQLGGWLHGAELNAAFKLADVVCLPSIFLEGTPMVILEGMAARKPVVITCFGGAPEVISDGETGYMVNPYDTAQMADRLIQLLSNPSTAAEMGAAGRQRVEAQFSLNRQTDAFIKVYQRLCAAGGRAL